MSGREAGTEAGITARWIDHADEERQIDIVHNVICGYVIEEGDDLSMRQIAVLVQIARQPMDITRLAHSLGLSLSTVSRSIDALEKHKYARRRREGRKVTAIATQLGAAKVGRLMGQVAKQSASAREEEAEAVEAA